MKSSKLNTSKQENANSGSAGAGWDNSPSNVTIDANYFDCHHISCCAGSGRVLPWDPFLYLFPTPKFIIPAIFNTARSAGSNCKMLRGLSLAHSSRDCRSNSISSAAAAASPCCSHPLRSWIILATFKGALVLGSLSPPPPPLPAARFAHKSAATGTNKQHQ